MNSDHQNNNLSNLTQTTVTPPDNHYSLFKSITKKPNARNLERDRIDKISDFHTGVRRGFGKHMRKIIFILIFITNVVTNFDHGALPAGTTTLMNELQLDSLTLGVLGSIVFLGLTFGASAAGILFNHYAPKWVVSMAIGSSCFFLYCFTQSTSVIGLGFTRFCCGFFQVFGMIYFPVWVDQFGVYDTRTMWLSYLQLGTPLGTMLGYVAEAVSIRMYDNWKIAFYIQIFLLSISGVILTLTPDKFFSKNYKRSEITRKLKQNKNNCNEETWQKNLIINGPKYTRLSDFSIYSLKDEDDESREVHYLELLNTLASNKVYTFTLLTVCCLLFIITGIQFWITDYMKVIMHISERTVYITFSIVCITAPTFGVLSGGYLIERLGGYADERALQSCYQISILAAVCGLPLPFINVFPIFVIFMWLTLFFGGSIVPGLTGIMLNSIPPDYKEVANSHTHFCFNLIGYFPAPFVYGLICKYTGGSESRWGLAALMIISVIGVLFLRYAKKHQNAAQMEILKQNSNLFESYLHHRKENNIHAPLIRKESYINTEAITALYGRVSMTRSPEIKI